MSKKHRPDVRALLDLTREDGMLFHDAKGAALEVPAASAPLADTHGHLTHFYRHDPVGALARASLVGMGLLGVPVDPVDDACDARALLDRMARWLDEMPARIDEMVSWGVRPCGARADLLVGNVRLWAGVHPYGSAEFNASEDARSTLDALLASPLCVGVGEFGLDYGPHNRCDPAEQRRAFVTQLRIAHERGLPVELHIRDAEGDAAAQAHADAVRILQQEGVPEAGCDLHCYTSDAEVMRPFVELGCFVAFGGAVTFSRSDDIRAAAAACPANLLLSETDSPYMAPMPMRGLECEPALVTFSADCVARVREDAGVASRGQTYASLWENACRLFQQG